jgi:uncharacterized protein (DUF2225 family)
MDKLYYEGKKRLTCPLCNATAKEHNKSTMKLKLLATEVKLAIFQLHN